LIWPCAFSTSVPPAGGRAPGPHTRPSHPHSHPGSIGVSHGRVRGAEGSTRHHDASNLAVTTTTKHSSSSTALRGNQRLRASALPKPTKRTPLGRSRRPPAAVLGARTSCGGQSKSIHSEGGCGAGLWHLGSPHPRLCALPRAIDELYISHEVHRRDARVGGVPSGVGRRPLPQLSALTAAPEPYRMPTPLATRGISSWVNWIHTEDNNGVRSQSPHLISCCCSKRGRARLLCDFPTTDNRQPTKNAPR
jgi:hypothetical protein